MYTFINVIEGMKLKWISVTSVIFIKYYSGYLIFDILYNFACYAYYIWMYKNLL